MFNDTIRRVTEQKVVAYYLLILNFILEKPGLNPDEEDFLK
jgi:hypothetical protein